MNLSFEMWREGKFYIARCPELRITTQGKNSTEAKENFREALQLHLRCMTDYLLRYRKVKIWLGKIIPVKA
jgi:predicted RNase H-like HicB family nuclease